MRDRPRQHAFNGDVASILAGIKSDNYGTLITRLACIKVYAATRLMRKPATQQLGQPALRITVGKAIATGCFNWQLQPERQFAMYKPG
jgi:hypothetical protein